MNSTGSVSLKGFGGRLAGTACLIGLALGGCQDARPPLEAGPGDLPPIGRDYRAEIEAWAGRYYAVPSSVHDVSVTDPYLTRDSTGRLVWLVCIEATARSTEGTMVGPERQAFGFAPNYVSAPLHRRGSSLTRQDCEARPLVWRQWRTFRAGMSR